MKKLIVLIVILSFSVLHAGIITVDNKIPSIGNYTTLQDAHDNAVNGDTIYVYPSPVTYSAITVTKPLIFLGTGFGGDFVEDGVLNSTLDDIAFDEGSAGASMEGFIGSEVNINADDITIKRNQLAKVSIGSDYTGNIISQNKIVNNISNCIYLGVNNSAWILNNMIITTSTGPGARCIETSGDCSLEIVNNVLEHAISSYYAIYVNGEAYIKNNIIVQGTVYKPGSVIYYNNMSSSSALPEGNGNINNVDMSTVFVDHENYDFHLLPDSPARGAGEDGVDMGIYGGASPFVDGGYPGIPSVIELDGLQIIKQSAGMDVSVNVKSNKE